MRREGEFAAGLGRRLLDRVLDASPDLLTVTMPDGVLRYVSGAALSVLGYPPEAMVGRHIHDFLYCDDIAIFQHELDTAASTDACVVTLQRWMRADGGTAWFESRLQHARNEPAEGSPLLVISSRDITARLLTERRLVMAEQRARRLADAVGEGIMVIDGERRIVSVNRACERILGRRAAELVGSVAPETFVLLDENGTPLPADRRPGPRAGMQGVEQHRRVGVLQPDGSVVWAQAHAVPLPSTVEPETFHVAVVYRELDQPGQAPCDRRAAAGLTARESEVLELMGQGLDPQRVARNLQISVHTARGHVKAILGKLGAHTQLEAIAVATRRGLLPELTPLPDGDVLA